VSPISSTSCYNTVLNLTKTKQAGQRVSVLS